MRRFVVLPGMHGTPGLLDDFAAAAPPETNVELITLPTHLTSYRELAAHLASTVRLTPDTILLAESFAGPLAILLADRLPLAALILCNTFAKRPYPGALGVLPLVTLARLRPPAFLARYFVLGARASDALVEQALRVVESVPPETLAARARSALEVDVRPELARCRLPILCLHGTEDHLIWKWNLNTVVRAATVPVTVAEIPAPHLLLKTAPREAWRAIDAFLDARGTSSTAPTPPTPSPSPRSY